MSTEGRKKRKGAPHPQESAPPALVFDSVFNTQIHTATDMPIRRELNPAASEWVPDASLAHSQARRAYRGLGHDFELTRVMDEIDRHYATMNYEQSLADEYRALLDNLQRVEAALPFGRRPDWPAR